MIDADICFYNHERIQTKTGVAPLKTEYFPTSGGFLSIVRFCWICSIKSHTDGFLYFRLCLHCKPTSQYKLMIQIGFAY